MQENVKRLKKQLENHFKKEPKNVEKNSVKVTVEELNDKDISFLHRLRSRVSAYSKIKRSGTGLTIICEIL